MDCKFIFSEFFIPVGEKSYSIAIKSSFRRDRRKFFRYKFRSTEQTYVNFFFYHFCHFYKFFAPTKHMSRLNLYLLACLQISLTILSHFYQLFIFMKMNVYKIASNTDSFFDKKYICKFIFTKFTYYNRIKLMSTMSMTQRFMKKIYLDIRLP